MKNLNDYVAEGRGSVVYEAGSNYGRRLTPNTTDDDLMRYIKEFAKGLLNGAEKARVDEEVLGYLEMFINELEKKQK